MFTHQTGLWSLRTKAYEIVHEDTENNFMFKVCLQRQAAVTFSSCFTWDEWQFKGVQYAPHVSPRICICPYLHCYSLLCLILVEKTQKESTVYFTLVSFNVRMNE